MPFETFALPLVWWVNKLPWLELNGFHLALTEGWLDTYRVQILPFVPVAAHARPERGPAPGDGRHPVLALFLALQRSFINSIASTGVKG